MTDYVTGNYGDSALNMTLTLAGFRPAFGHAANPFGYSVPDLFPSVIGIFGLFTLFLCQRRERDHGHLAPRGGP